MADSMPPPIYTTEHDGDTSSIESTVTREELPEPQILIIPTVDAINFQKGFLGAEGERAAIEGELQIKGIEPVKWSKITVSLRTVEVAFRREIELGFSEVEVCSQDVLSRNILPSPLLFSIPLMPDTPQVIRTPNSSLTHTLTACLQPADSSMPALSKSLLVHTRRFTAHSHTLPISPETHQLSSPADVRVELPRSTFKAGELIPLYVTIPPPSTDVLDQGIRLRNVRVEFVRIVRVKRNDDEPEVDDEEDKLPDEDNRREGPSTGIHLSEKASTSTSLLSPLFLGSSFRMVLARSGAQCRFHASRPVQLRFLLHPPTALSDVEEPSVRLTSDAESPWISQSTVLHSVTFRAAVHISFVNVTNHTEQISTISIPITVLPPSAPLPEVAESIQVAYQKKHDRPPLKTNRVEDDDATIPHYSEGEAGPSALPNGAPPPFEERDAPPPFFPDDPGPSVSRLPTFLESESEIIIPEDASEVDHCPPLPSPLIPGEGFEFGFPASAQFDGHSADMQRSSTPPPTLEMASMDTNVTRLAEIIQPEATMEGLTVVLDASTHANEEGEPPPPPPPMDDPSDPPPSIDSEFRSPEHTRRASPSRSSPVRHLPYTPADPLLPNSSAPGQQDQTPHAPPPYLVPDGNNEQQTSGPPPYVD